MRNGFQVFDADAHVNYPPDLWSRFLDKEYRDRIGRRARRRVRPLQPGHRRRPVHPAPHVDPRPVPEGDQLDHRGHARQVRRHRHRGLHRRSRGRRDRARGRRRDGDLRARVRHVARRHRPRAPGRDGARVQPLGSGDARDVERRRDHERTGPAQRRHARRRRRSSTRTSTSASSASGHGPTSSTTAAWATATTTRSTSCCRISTARSRPTSTWGSTRSPPAPSASTRSPSGTPSCIRTRRRTRSCR